LKVIAAESFGRQLIVAKSNIIFTGCPLLPKVTLFLAAKYHQK
jgi:hypothetical protein